MCALSLAARQQLMQICTIMTGIIVQCRGPQNKIICALVEFRHNNNYRRPIEAALTEGVPPRNIHLTVTEDLPARGNWRQLRSILPQCELGTASASVLVVCVPIRNLSQATWLSRHMSNKQVPLIDSVGHHCGSSSDQLA